MRVLMCVMILVLRAHDGRRGASSIGGHRRRPYCKLEFDGRRGASSYERPPRRPSCMGHC